ncbi:hypothetical protein RND71_042044 [Anisodus tanguticus]|uniref:TPD1 protein homolog 1-like n=1 Tax=Anisodus tanguticus TaxID=243964 RepID=A0AAE1QSS3_9SOLA|nr:hypothetical protein RND71_042044 [Anisodus tanguticus]
MLHLSSHGKKLWLAFVSLILFPFISSCMFDYTRKCSPSDIQIYQGPSGFSGLHIPQYTVQIVNEASASNGVFDVQIHCGEFASADLIEPSIFKRIGCGICLLKNGKRVLPGEVISFEYSNILPYDFSVVQVKC